MYTAIFVTGFAAMAAQIVLTRELLVVFYGNELCAGIMLASWLFWVAAGSIASRIKRYTEEAFHILLLSLPVVLPLTIFFIRNTRYLTGTATGEMIGIIPASVASFVFLAPCSFIFGALFALACRLTSEPAKTYIVESAGAVAGALAFGFLLVQMLGPVQTALFCGLLTSASVLLIAERRRSPPRWWTTFAFTVSVGIFLAAGSGALDFNMRRMQWRGLGLESVKDTKFGNIAITRRGAQTSVFENGLIVSSSDDTLAAELSAHIAMLTHPSPRRVLLIGGSLGGTLDEILKHPVGSVDYVELDPDLLKPSADPRAHARLEDGRLFVKRAAAAGAGGLYDAVIVALPNPYTAQINRFYSLEFFRDVRKILARDGLFSFTVASSADYISRRQAQFLACLERTLGKQFAGVRIIPGDTAVFLAGGAAVNITADSKALAARLAERQIRTSYVNAHYLPDILDPMRIEYARKAVAEVSGVKLNLDFRPAGYYYDVVLWSARADPRLSALLEKLNGIDANILLFAAFAVFAAFAAVWRLFYRRDDLPCLLSVAAAGFSGMTAQVCLIIAFQAVYGYVYGRIGLLYAAFMAGLAVGGVLGARVPPGRASETAFRRAQPFFFLYSFLIAASLLAGLRFPQAVFFLLTAFPGVLTGFIYPLSVRICSEARPDNAGAHTAGLVYGVDLAGACAGALLVSSVVIPVMGISRAFLLAGALSFACACLLYLQPLRSRT